MYPDPVLTSVTSELKLSVLCCHLIERAELPLTVKLPVFPLQTVAVLVAAVPATGLEHTYSYAPIS